MRENKSNVRERGNIIWKPRLPTSTLPVSNLAITTARRHRRSSTKHHLQKKKNTKSSFFFFANTLFCFSCFFSGTCLAKSPFTCYNPLAFGRNRQATSNWIHTPQTGTRRAAEEKKRMEHQPTPQAGATFSNLRCRTSHLLRATTTAIFPLFQRHKKEERFPHISLKRWSMVELFFYKAEVLGLHGGILFLLLPRNKLWSLICND